jgi:hypothetical protein
MSIFDRIKGALGLGPKLRNRPGRMAWIRGIAPGNGSEKLNGRAVKTVRINAETGLWLVKPSQVFLATADCAFGLSKRPVKKGQAVAVSEISDELLEPWKDDGVTPMEVACLYEPAPAKAAPVESQPVREKGRV